MMSSECVCTGYLLTYRVQRLPQYCLQESCLREAPWTEWQVTGRVVSWVQAEEAWSLQLVEKIWKLCAEGCRVKGAEN